MPRTLVAAALSLLLLATAAAAQFTDTGQVNNEYDRTDPALVAWASEVVELIRGPQDYQDPSLGDASYGAPTDLLGPAGTPVSLGDGGHVTLGFPVTIVDGPGDDLVVFENGFAWNGVYMELGFVEVSSDGVNFARLPALCRRTTQPGPWDTSDPADFYNLAGNFVGGTGIDLHDLVLAGDPLVADGTVDLAAIRYVRLVDVVGDIDGPGATFDWLGRPVADPYPTPGETCGMDPTGVAVLHAGAAVADDDVTWSDVKRLFR